MTTEEMVGGLSPEARELFMEMGRRVEETGGDVPGSEMEDYADRADALPDRDEFAQVLTVHIQAQDDERAALMERADAMHGVVGMISRAEEIAGHDSGSLSVGRQRLSSKPAARTHRSWRSLRG
jgi:hypothetical protein